MIEMTKLYGNSGRIKFIKLKDINLLRPLKIEGLRDITFDISEDEFDSMYLSMAISVLSKNIKLSTEYIVELILDLLNHDMQSDIIKVENMSKGLLRDMTNNLHDLISYLNDVGWCDGNNLISWHVKIGDEKIFAYIALFEDLENVKDT